MESSGLLTPQSASLVEEGKVAFIADLQQQWMKGEEAIEQLIILDG
jgi:hypothetical protein